MSRAARGALLIIATVLVAMTPAVAQTGPDPLRPEQWNLDKVKVDDLRPFGRGAGAVVSVVSTGIRSDHPDLAGQTVGGRNFVEGESSEDENGLGTHISGIVSAITDNGEGIASIAPEAKLMSVKVLDRSGRSQPDPFFTALHYGGTAMEGIPIKVLLFTLPINWDSRRDPDLQAAITDIAAKGVLVVTAATPIDHLGEAPVIRVAGLDASDAPTPDSGSPGLKFGLSAPGDAMYSTSWRIIVGNSYEEDNGIDRAAAHVAAAGAVLMGKGLNAAQTATVLVTSARDLGAPGPDPTYGHGALDLARAAQLAAQPPPPTTPTTKKPSETTVPKPGDKPPGTAKPAPVAPTTIGPARPPRSDPTNPFGPEQPAETPASALELQEDRTGGDDKPWGLLAVALAGVFLSFGGLSRTMLKLATAPPE